MTDEEEKLRAPAATALNLCAHPASPQGRGANIGKDVWGAKTRDLQREWGGLQQEPNFGNQQPKTRFQRRIEF